MAAAAVDEDGDVLTCSVCLDTYTDPCSLQCKHSFCRRCLTDYIKTQAKTVKTKTIPCPSCRQITRVPDPSRPVDEWAGQLQPGHVVQELMARGNNNKRQETPCYQCKQLGEITPGKFWCADCEVVFCERCGKGHSVIPSCRDHDLCELKDQGQISRRKSRCREHRDKLIELYCKNCNVSHCQLCFVDHHRKCEDVVTLKSLVSNMKTELSEVKNQLKEQEKKSNSLVEDQKTRITQLNTDKVSVIEEILSAGQKAVDLIKKKEKRLLDQVEDIINRETNELKAKVKLANIQVQTYRQYSEYIKQAVSSDSEVEVCDVYQAWKSGQLEISQEGGKGMGSGNISSVLFSKEKQNITIVINTVHLGEIIAFEPVCDPRTSPVLNESVDTRVDEDEKDSVIKDITVLEVEDVNTIVVTDYNNKCIKSFYTRNNQTCHSRLQLNGSPEGIAHLGDNRVMVTVTDPNQIVTVLVTPDLVYMTHINTRKAYFSLAVMSSSRLAAGINERVDILNMQGEVMKSVTTYAKSKLFSVPRQMCVNKSGLLLVSDSCKKTVTCLIPDGQVAWRYPGTGGVTLRDPTGILTTRGGNILVADRHLRKVIQFTRSGQFVRDVVTSRDCFIKPIGICVDKHGSLFVCDGSKVLKFVFLRR